mgnify:CR=1 FL=1
MNFLSQIKTHFHYQIRDEKKMQHYEIKEGNKNVNVISVYQDKVGGIWLGTLENGVYNE